MKKNPNEYADIAAVLDAVLPRGGGTYTLPTYAGAIRWAQRAYNLRKALRELSAETRLPGQAPYTKYDDMTLKVEKPHENKSEPHVVRIEFKRLQGILTDLEGNVVEPLGLRTTTPGKLEEEIDEMMKGLE